jgi:hypothetical protein
MVGILSLVFEMPKTYAQEISPFEQIADIYHQRAGAYSCEFASKAIQKIKEQSEQQIHKSLENSLVQLDLKLEQDNKTFKDKIISGLQSICRTTRLPIQKAIHSAAFTNSALLNTAALAIGVPINLLKGTIGTKKSIRREDFIYHVMGPQHGEGPFLLGLLIFQAPDLLLGFNPAFALVNGSIAIELITNYQCRSVNPLNKEKMEFCQSYQDLKTYFQSANKKSFDLGKKIRVYLNKKAEIKQINLGAEGFCSLERSEQVELARKTLERRDYLKYDDRIKSAEVLLPIHKNQCAKILIQTNEELEDLKKDYEFIDSISVVVLKDGEYPESYYFTQAELDKLNIEEQLCHEVERDYFGEFAQNKNELTENFFKSVLAPSLLSQPQTQKIILDDSQVYRGDVSHLRNVIFTLAPVRKNEVQFKFLKEERKKIIKDIKENYKKIIRSKKFQSCIDVIRRRGFDVDEFTASIRRLTEIQNNPLMKNQQELDLIKKIIKKSRYRLKLGWELIESNQISDIINLLKSPDVGNVIILGHAKSSGHFVDSAQQEFPREAFAEISPSIMSINFYTCHSQTLVDLYQFKQKLKQNNSLYKIRYLTHVGQNDFLGSENFAPISSFGNYLINLDKFLLRSQKGAILLQDNYQAQLPRLPIGNTCTADVSGLRIKNGSYGIILNDQFIGATSVDRPGKNLSFDCSFLKKGMNTLKIKNIQNEGGSDFDVNNIKISIGEVTLGVENATLKKSSFTILKFNY